MCDKVVHHAQMHFKSDSSWPRIIGRHHDQRPLFTPFTFLSDMLIKAHRETLQLEGVYWTLSLVFRFLAFLNYCFIYPTKALSFIRQFINTMHTTLKMWDWQFIRTNFVSQYICKMKRKTKHKSCIN